MTLSGTNVDYTAALAEAGASAPSVGQTLAVIGTQPVAGGTVLVSTTNATSSAATAAANGQLASNVSSALQKGGGVGAALQKGGGIDSALQKGGGVGAALQKGGGASDE